MPTPLARILIVDDEPAIRTVLSAQLRRNYDVAAVANGAEAISKLHAERFDLVLTDMRMPNVDGLELLGYVRQHFPEVPVIVLTAHGTVDSAVEAIKLGAHDFITKPFDELELAQVIAKAMGHARAAQQAVHADAQGRFEIIGRTPGMKQVFSLIEKVADSPTTVLIQGESGTGKELVARALHEQSGRADKPFIQVNCGAIPENLFESELFGYERGAFTGAVTSKPGRFELADGGTMMLDEVRELPRDMQVKLLRVLQEGTFERVGGLDLKSVDVRVVAATNVDLAQEVSDERFREDLYYRLNVILIQIPPLRERLDDIPLLVEHFLRKFNERLGRTIRGVGPEGLAALMAHAWPGNVRELENVIERAVLLAEGDEIGISELSHVGGAAQMGSESATIVSDFEELDLKEYVRMHTVQIERARIQRALEAEDGNVTRAAKRLGISRKSLQIKMKEYGLRDPAP